jgi:hypothetical protein
VCGVTYSEAFENREQKHLPLQRRHLGQRLLQPAAHTLALATIFERTKGLLQAMEESEHAELAVLGFAYQFGLLHHHFGTQADPFVAALL